MSDITGRTCPLLKSECIGVDCAMAVKADHPMVSSYRVFWYCGLVAGNPEKLANPKVIAVTDKERRSE